MWSGRTRQNKLVHFSPGDQRRAPGGTADVVGSPTPRRTGCAASSSASRPPRRARVRIPVAAG